MVRLDRYSEDEYSSRKGGGLIMAIKETLKYEEIDVSTEMVQFLIIKVRSGHSWIFICLVYFVGLTPRQIFEHFFEIVQSSILPAMNDGDQLIFVGDFNFPTITWDWADTDFVPTLSPSDSTGAFVLDSLHGLGTKQFNTIYNENGRLLDLVFSTTEAISISACEDLAGHSSMYHTPLLIELNFLDFSINSFKSNKFFLDFRCGDYHSLNNYFDNIDWIETIKNGDVEDSVCKFNAVLKYGIDKFIPRKKCKKTVYEPWFNTRLLNLSKLRDKAHKLFKSTRNPLHYERFSKLRTEFKFLNHFLYENYILKIESEIKCDPKRFFSFIDTKKHTVGFPCSMSYNNETLNNSKQICDGFKQLFSSVYDSECSNTRNANIAKKNHGITISENDVYIGLLKLDVSKGAGPDGISPLLLKNCAINLCIPLTRIFNISLGSGIFPDCWKLSFLRPIFKSGNRSHVSNYRGVAILSAIPKFFESLVKDIIQFRFINSISNFQHGFLPGRSTVSNLMVFSNFIFNSIQAGNQVDVIYTDFSKAFDKVSHTLLIEKLNLIDSEYSLPLSWLQSYLTNRKQFVRIEDHDSDLFEVSSGVPQGSHLGPLLFILFINDVGQCFRFAKFLMYADDLKIYAPVKSFHEAILLQNDLERFCDWSHENKLLLNTQKCKVMSFYKKHFRLNYNYNIYNTVIERVLFFRDLGIIFSFDLSFNRHIDFIISKANSMLGFIKRNSKDFCDPYTLRTLYISLVRSNLEYASVVWTPFYNVHNERIESVQRQFLIFCLRKLPSQRLREQYVLEPYVDRLRLINLKPLSIRRSIACCMFVRDILCSRINCAELLMLYGIYVPSRQMRSRNFILNLPFSRTNYGLAEPVFNTTRQFNNVVSVFDFNLSREIFKSNLFIFFGT